MLSPLGSSLKIGPPKTSLSEVENNQFDDAPPPLEPIENVVASVDAVANSVIVASPANEGAGDPTVVTSAAQSPLAQRVAPLKSFFLLVLDDMIGKLFKIIWSPLKKKTNQIKDEEILKLLDTKKLSQINIIGRKNGLHNEPGKEYWSGLSLESKLIRGATQLAKSFKSVDVKNIKVDGVLAKLDQLRTRMSHNAVTNKGKKLIEDEMAKAIENLKAQQVAPLPPVIAAPPHNNPPPLLIKAVQNQADHEQPTITSVLSDYVIAPVARNIWPIARVALIAGLTSFL